jgi:formate dehydrogenase iron-sulfur subunit
VGALKRSPEGPVVYDPVICMGCRYCLLACPFAMTRYEWSSPTPRVRKCLLCHQKISDGELDQPACTAACPTGATIFGEREALLEEARRRTHANPERYIDHIWGEHEIGGTSILYISDVDLDEAGWPHELGNDARPELARNVLHTVPYTFVGVAAAMYGVHWTFERRKTVAEAESGSGTSPTDAVDSEAGEEL